MYVLSPQERDTGRIFQYFSIMSFFSDIWEVANKRVYRRKLGIWPFWGLKRMTKADVQNLPFEFLRKFQRD